MSNSVTPWTVARHVPLSMGFPRQEYWSGLPFPSAGDLPNPRIEPESLALAGRFFTIREALKCHWPTPYQEEVFPFQGAHLPYNLQGRIGQKSHPKANHTVILFIKAEAKCDQCLAAQTVKNLPAMQETWVQSLVGKIPCRRNWLPTPVFLPREFHGQRSLAGYSPWGHRVRHN